MGREVFSNESAPDYEVCQNSCLNPCAALSNQTFCDNRNVLYAAPYGVAIAALSA